MNALKATFKWDTIGAITSSLCLIHCLATPLLFVAQAGLTGHGTAHPFWWGLLDVVFLAVSFIAVRWSANTTSKPWIRTALWINWIVLALIVINEKVHVVHLAEEIIYLPTLSLIGLHLYNRKYCQCGDDACCADGSAHS